MNAERVTIMTREELIGLVADKLGIKGLKISDYNTPSYKSAWIIEADIPTKLQPSVGDCIWSESTDYKPHIYLYILVSRGILNPGLYILE